MTSAIATSSGKLVFFVGVNTGLVTNGLPDQRYVDFYRRRSSSRLHCAIVGNVIVPGGHGSNGSTPSIDCNPVWTTVATAIRANGTLPGVQLATAWAGYEGTRKFVSPNGYDVIARAQELVRSLGPQGIDLAMSSFSTAAAMAAEHGFGHIQIHSAHGYLPSLLVDERINPTAEEVRERLRAVAQWLRTRQIESSIRISLRTGDPVFDASGAEAFQDAMATLDFDFVDLSSGFYNIDKRLIYPSRPEILAARLEESVAVALRHPNQQFIVSGRMIERNAMLPPNAHLGLCRDLIANPRFLSEPGNGCRNHGKCHYFSRGSDHVTCPRWVETDLE